MNFGIILGFVGLILIIIGFVLRITNDTRAIRKQNKAPEKTREPDSNKTKVSKCIQGENYTFNLNFNGEVLHYHFGYSSKLWFRLKRTVHYHNLEQYCKMYDFSFCLSEIYADGLTIFLLSTDIYVPYCDLSEFERSKAFRDFLSCLTEVDKQCCSSESRESQVAAVDDHYKRIADILCD